MSIRRYLGVGLLYCTAGFAGTMGPLDIPLGNYGFYVGGTLGLASLIDQQATLSSNGNVDSRRFGATGFVGGGLIGYDFCLGSPFELAVEGFLTGTELRAEAVQIYAPTSTYSARMRYSAGLRLLPAYELSEGTLGHLILGYSHALFKINDDNYGLINADIPRNGYQVGLGMVLPCFMNNLSLRGDVLYNSYRASTNFGLFKTLNARLPYYNTFSSFEGDLSLIYKFS